MAVKPTNVRWAEYEANVWEMGKAYIGLMVKPEGKSQFGIQRHR
jgi:hypothetical protein